MPALLPPEKRKSLVTHVRFNKIYKNILKAQAKYHNCRTISIYFRKLVSDDVNRTN